MVGRGFDRLSAGHRLIAQGGPHVGPPVCKSQRHHAVAKLRSMRVDGDREPVRVSVDDLVITRPRHFAFRTFFSFSVSLLTVHFSRSAHPTCDVDSRPDHRRRGSCTGMLAETGIARGNAVPPNPSDGDGNTALRQQGLFLVLWLTWVISPLGPAFSTATAVRMFRRVAVDRSGPPSAQIRQPGNDWETLDKMMIDTIGKARDSGFCQCVARKASACVGHVRRGGDR
jgi:hypothetical protein